MAGKYLVALDAGTSGARCFVFDAKVRAIAMSSQPWSYTAPEDGPSLAREFRPQAFWKIITQLIPKALREAGVRANEVAGVAVTGQRQGLVFMDSRGDELYAGPNLDLRAVFQGAALEEEMGQEIYFTTGHLPSFLLAPAKLKWFQAQRPESFQRIATVLTLPAWVVFRLTGERVDEVSLAGEAGLLDVGRRTANDGLLKHIGVAPHPSPRLICSSAVAGKMGASAAEDCGLLKGTPVVLAGPDTKCGLAGMGVLGYGEMGIVAGWSAPVQMVTLRPVFDRRMRTWTGCHVVAARWVLESSAGDTGNVYQWLRGILSSGRGEMSYAEMDRMAQEVPRGAEGAMAFLGPGPMDVRRLGLRPGGVLLPAPLTFQGTGPGHLTRAALESIAFSLKANVRQLEHISRRPLFRVSLGGGMAQSAVFARILADVLKQDLHVFPANVSATGAALCGWTAAGMYASLTEAASEGVGPGSVVDPDPLGAAEYQELYDQWLKRYRRLQRDRLS